MTGSESKSNCYGNPLIPPLVIPVTSTGFISNTFNEKHGENLKLIEKL